MKARRGVGPQPLVTWACAKIDHTGERNIESRSALGVSALRALGTSADVRGSRRPKRTKGRASKRALAPSLRATDLATAPSSPATGAKSAGT